jgi:hypothetical protein
MCCVLQFSFLQDVMTRVNNTVKGTATPPLLFALYTAPTQGALAFILSESHTRACAATCTLHLHTCSRT